MVVPQTVNKGFYIPNTGDLAGTWGSAALNPDFTAIDGITGGFVTVSLTNTNVTLTAPAAFTATPGAGPVQSQNAMITFTGTLTGNVTITFPLPGYYIINNLCVVGAFYVKLASSSPGNVICAPPGEAVHVFCDGTNMYYVNLGRIGSYIDLATSAVPAWITNCTVAPYLNCDGSAFSSVTFPQLSVYLGGTTLPDLRGRVRVALNQTTGRVTSAVSGIDGNTLLSAGGNEALQGHTHTGTTASGGVDHTHSSNSPFTTNAFAIGGGGPPASYANNSGSQLNWTTGAASAYLHTHTITTNSTGAGSSQNMPPATVAGLTLIRAG